MTTDRSTETWTRAERRRRIAVGLARAAVVTVLLVFAYYVAPLDRLDSVPVAIVVLIGIVLVAAMSAVQVNAVIRSPLPAVRAIEALATTVPLFLLLFAAIYFVVSQGDSGAFNTPALTRTDCLYFTVTVFSTVGFGDISAASQSTRVLVTAQMVLDLLVLGIGVQVFLKAVAIGRQRDDA